MAFTELRQTLDHDPQDLRRFAEILHREVASATHQLESAFELRDAASVADIRHKLKTSLKLLEANGIRAELDDLVTDMRNGTEVTEARTRALLASLRSANERLAAEPW